MRHVSALVGSAAVFLGGSTAASAAAGTAGRTPTGPQGGYNDPEEGDITNESEAQHQQDRENAAKLKRAQVGMTCSPPSALRSPQAPLGRPLD